MENKRKGKVGEVHRPCSRAEILVEYVGDGDIDYNLNPSYWKRD